MVWELTLFSQGSMTLVLLMQVILVPISIRVLEIVGVRISVE